MDARLGQVYTGIYRYCDGKPVPLIKTRAAAIEELLDILEGLKPETVIFTGDGVPVFRQLLLERQGSMKFRFAPPHLSRQRAAATAYLAMEKYRERGEEAFVSAERFRPEYLRLSRRNGKSIPHFAQTAGARRPHSAKYGIIRCLWTYWRND